MHVGTNSLWFEFEYDLTGGCEDTEDIVIGYSSSSHVQADNTPETHIPSLQNTPGVCALPTRIQRTIGGDAPTTLSGSNVGYPSPAARRLGPLQRRTQAPGGLPLVAWSTWFCAVRPSRVVLGGGGIK